MLPLETDRLQLCQFTLHDVDQLAALYANPKVMQFVGKGAKTRPESEAELQAILKHWQKNHFGLWAMISKANGDFVGECGLQFLENTSEVELGYTLNQQYWHQGLATEGSLASLKYGFEEMGCDRIVAIAHPKNIASQRVMQKAGMKFEKTAYYYGGEVVFYAISKVQFQTKRT